MKIKYPKGWNKMKLKEQENWLVAELSELHAKEDLLKKDLAKVRGGKKVSVSEEIDRLDLLEMKVTPKD